MVVTTKIEGSGVSYHSRTVIVLLSTIFAFTLLSLRTWITADVSYLFFIWNGFLALLCYPLSSWLLVFHQKRDGQALGIGWYIVAAVWLLLWPNSIYLLTDFAHLQSTWTLTMWIDLLLISSFVWWGILLGVTSLRQVQVVVANRFGKKISWAFSVISLYLCSLGIYLGRVPRFNSWDVLTNPATLTTYLVDAVADPFSQVPVAGFVGILGTLLVLMYFSAYAEDFAAK